MNNAAAPLVRAIAVSKRFGVPGRLAVHAVRDVSLDVHRREILLVSGPSGSGKTTLLSMLGCLIEPSGGRIEIGGATVTALDQRGLTAFRLAHIGFIFQAFRLLDALTVLENVEVVLSLAGAARSASRRRAEELLGELGVSHLAQAFPGGLSGGEKQRVAIARAFANDPDVILADEPTGSLDSAAGQAVIELLCTAAQSRGKAVIIVSHDPRIARYADRILRIEDGAVTPPGTSSLTGGDGSSCFPSPRPDN